VVFASRTVSAGPSAATSARRGARVPPAPSLSGSLIGRDLLLLFALCSGGSSDPWFRGSDRRLFTLNDVKGPNSDREPRHYARPNCLGGSELQLPRNRFKRNWVLVHPEARRAPEDSSRDSPPPATVVAGRNLSRLPRPVPTRSGASRGPGRETRGFAGRTALYRIQPFFALAYASAPIK